ncbi:MAG: hypothetical protein ABFC28_08155 [Rikenellaceae bacterium]
MLKKQDAKAKGFIEKRKKIDPMIKKFIIIAGIIVITGFLLYFWNYHSNFSNSSSDWANFAIFNGYFLNIINMIILGYLYFLVYKTTNEYNKLLIKPILYANNIFKNDKITEPELGHYIWVLGNASKHPAVNIIIRHTITKNIGEKTIDIGTTRWISCSSLAGDQSMELFWIYYAYSIEICYTDATEENYYLSTIANLRVTTKTITKEFYEKSIKEADENQNNNIINLMEKYRRDQFSGHHFGLYITYLKYLNLLSTDYIPDLVNRESRLSYPPDPETTSPAPN